MKRPQSAKIGMRGYWGQSNTDEVSEHNISNKNLSKKQVVLMKPDLTSHDFSRILPKKIHQDKERLYSQTLQLKQSVNQLTQENMRLKTKISILEKEKSRMGKYLESAQEAPSKKSQSRLNLYASKISDKQNNIVQNLKKMVRQAKEEVEYLKSESIKIKKTIKYTKINEMEIEKKILYDENKRIGRMLEDVTQHINDQTELERENAELKKYLEEEMEENKIITEENQKYEEIVEELENKIRSEVEKYQTKEKKLQRDLALEKRKNQQSHKYIEDLRKELTSMKTAQQIQKPKPVVKNVVRPSSSNPNKRFTSNQPIARQVTSKVITKKEETIVNDQIISKSQTEEIKAKNSQLEQELRDIKSKLERSQNQLKQRGSNKQKQNLLRSLAQKEKQSPKKQSNPQKQQTIKQKAQSIKAPSQPKITQERPNQNLQIQSPNKKEEQSYNQQSFDKEQESYNYEQEFEKVDQAKQSRLQEQIQKVKQDFQENQEEQEIYKKQESKKGKNPHKKKKKEGQSSSNKKKGAFKPNKKILAQIKQLLTYRMKSQRYPFSDLKGDIESAQSSAFSYSDLCEMFINEPFYLTAAYSKVLLSYCYESDIIGQNQLLKSDSLVGKLRKVVQDFELMDEDEEKEMIIRISQMTCTYPQELEAAFQDIKNGDETVSKAELIKMFEKLQLQPKYIELIIAELSLCSDDLEHLNFHGFFQRFYVDEDPNTTDIQNPIEEQGEQSEQSYRQTNKRKKSSKPNNVRKNSQDEEQDYQMGRYMMAVDNRVSEKPKKFDDEDIVSDDGRI